MNTQKYEFMPVKNEKIVSQRGSNRDTRRLIKQIHQLDAFTIIGSIIITLLMFWQLLLGLFFILPIMSICIRIGLRENIEYFKAIQYYITTKRIVKCGKHGMTEIYYKDIAFIIIKSEKLLLTSEDTADRVIMQVFKKCPDGSSYLTQDKLLDNDATTFIYLCGEIESIFIYSDTKEDELFQEKVIEFLKTQIELKEYPNIEKSRDKAIEQYREKNELDDKLLEFIYDDYGRIRVIYLCN